MLFFLTTDVDAVAARSRELGGAEHLAPVTMGGARMAVGVPQANGQLAPEPRLDLAHVVDAIRYIAALPLEANVQFMTVMATKMPLIGRG